MKKSQHVVPQNGKWAVKGEGSSKASGVFDKQADAIDHARDKARSDGSPRFLSPEGVRSRRMRRDRTHGQG